MLRSFFINPLCISLILCSASLLPSSMANEVDSVLPDQNRNYAPVSTNVVVNFDEAVDSDTINSATFVVHRAFRSPVTGSFTPGSTNFVFDPDIDFLPGELITSTVTDGVESGGVPATPFVWQFRTAVSAGNGLFVDSGQLIVGSTRTESVALGDIDNDGDLDAFTCNYEDGPDQIYKNNGFGTFTLFQEVGHDRNHHVALGDLDGDGDLDAITISGVYGEYDHLFFNDGSGTFTDSGQTLTSGYHHDGDLGDVDGDGDLDVFVTHYPEAGPFVYLNNGSGILTVGWTGPSTIECDAAALGDLDRDGDLDVYLACQSFWGTDYYDRVFLNNGAGSFTDTGQLLGAYDSTDVALADIDGDGDLDAITAHSDNYARVWTNTGSGGFTERQEITTASTHGVIVGDLDADNDLDFYLVGRQSSRDSCWLNDGSGTFAKVWGASWSGSLHAALGDLDGNGSLDNFVVVEYADDLVLLNDPPPSPTPTTTDTPTPIPTDTPSPSPTSTPTLTPTQTATHTSTPSATNTPTATNLPTDTPTGTPTEIPTSLPTSTNTPTTTPSTPPTQSPTTVPTATATSTQTQTPTRTPSFTPTRTPTSVPTHTATNTPTNTPTRTPTSSPTASPTATFTHLPSPTPTKTSTATPTPVSPFTATPSPVSTATSSPTMTAIPTATATPDGQIQVEVMLNQTDFHSGDTLELSISMSNHTSTSPTVNAWLILRVLSAFYFFQYDTSTIPPALNLTSYPIPMLTFPFLAGMDIPAVEIWEITFPQMEIQEPMDGTFYFALLSENNLLLSNLSSVDFSIGT